MSETELPEFSGKVLAIWLIGRGSECKKVVQPTHAQR